MACAAWPTAALLLAAASCGRPEAAPEPAPGDYQRIAVIGPSTAANLWAAGQGHRVVAVSDYCLVPEAEDLPRLGGQLDPALERLAQLEPDLVLVQGEMPSLARWCARSGIPFHSFTTDTVRDWKDEMAYLGALLREREAFAAVKDGLEERLQRVRASAAARAEAERDDRAPAGDVSWPRTTLLVVSRRPAVIGGLIVAGPPSFLSEMLTVAGGRNVLDGAADYVDLSEELLLTLQPECILEFHPGGVADGDAPLPLWREAFPTLPAVREGRVTPIEIADALMPGPHMDRLAQALHVALDGID